MDSRKNSRSNQNTFRSNPAEGLEGLERLEESRGHVLTDRVLAEIKTLAKETGSVAEACRRLGIDRTAYYRQLRRAGKARAIPGRSPLATSLETESRLLALCLEYPEWGCDRLAWYMTLKGDPVSSPTVQKILIRHGLGRSPQRCLASRNLDDEGVRAGFESP